MGTTARDDDEFSLTIQQLSSAVERLKTSHGLSEAMLIVRTVVTSAYGADSPPTRAPHAHASQPQPPTAHVSNSAKKRARKSKAAREAADIKRAAYLRSVAEGLDPVAAANDDSEQAGAKQHDAASSTSIATSSHPATPTHDHSAEWPELGSDVRWCLDIHRIFGASET